MTTIKIKLPETLPAEKLTPVKFKAWKGQLIVYLKQSPEYRRFLPAGIYSTWSANVDVADRIQALHASDIPGDAPARAPRLVDRQTQLETFLSIIASICHSSQYDDVMQRSTSVEWIWNLIESDYDIQKTGRHFLKIDEISFKKGTESHNAYYKRLRSHFSDNLRKTGEKQKSKNDTALTEDEKLSPTLENTIVYMALKDIDPRLPAHVEQIYGHRMDKDTTLFDLQVEIFQALPKLITDLDTKDANLGAIQGYQHYGYQQTTEEQEQPDLAAFGYNQRGGRGGPPHRGQYNRPRGAGPRPQFQNAVQPRFRVPPSNTGKLCNLCRDARFPPRVYLSHNMNTCNRWNRDTVAQIRNMVLEENIDPNDYPDPEEDVYEEA